MTSGMTEREELKPLSVKYGIVMLVLFINRLFAMPLLWQGLSAAGLVPQADDAHYMARMLANEVASYLLPLTATAFLLGREARFAPGGDSYRKLRCGTLLLFICGIGAGSLGSLVTEGLTSLAALIFGTKKPSAAFSGLMPTNGVTFAALLFCTGIIAPICEELIFRHFLLKPLRKYGDMTAALITSVIFGLYHANLSQLAYTMLVGFFLAVIAVRANSIKPAVIVHIANNVMVGIMNYLPEGFGDPRADLIFGTASAVLSAAVNVAVIAGLALMLVPPVRNTLKLHTNCGMTQREQILRFCSEPVAAAGIIVMTAAFFI